MIGNGFDIAQGARTRYTDFYEVFKECEPVNGVERLMIEQINGEEVETWAYLEKRLGEFSQECDDAEEFTTFYLHMADELRKYLDDEAAAHPVQATEKYAQDIWEPERYFNPAEKNKLSGYIHVFNRENISLNAISFNYTNLFEDAIGYNGTKVLLKSRFPGSSFSIEHVYKIHGQLGGTPLLGVNDSSQIANQEFCNNEDLLDILVKPQANSVIGSLVDENCATAINNANLIILHGLSLGETDKTWWERIGKRLMRNDNIRIMFFYFIKDYDVDAHAYLQGKYKREAKKLFFDACGIPEEKRDSLASNVYVSINSDFLVPKRVGLK